MLRVGNVAALLGIALLGSACDSDILDAFSGVYFVKLDSEPANVVAEVNDIANALDLDVIHIYDNASEGFSVRLPHLLIEDVEELKGVEYVMGDEDTERIPREEQPKDEEDVVDDPVQVGADEIPESIARIGGPYLGNVDLSGVHVAVIDTGIDASHPDLNVVADIDIVAQSGAGDAAPGGDPNGHGTHCAGTIGARANGEGVVGVAPGVPLHAVRVLGADGSGYWSDIVAGVEYVMEHPEIKVVSMSLGGPAMNGNDPLMDAIDRLVDSGVVVVIAAGNSADDTQFYAPAGYDLGLVVSAYDASNGSDSGFAWFSNYGSEVDISAPGVKILSTWPGGGYTELDGTSMATPAVAGAAAVYRALDTNAGPTQVVNKILNNGEDGYSGQQGDHTEPMLDTVALFNAAP